MQNWYISIQSWHTLNHFKCQTMWQTAARLWFNLIQDLLPPRMNAIIRVHKFCTPFATDLKLLRSLAILSYYPLSSWRIAQSIRYWNCSTIVVAFFFFGHSLFSICWNKFEPEHWVERTWREQKNGSSLPLIAAYLTYVDIFDQIYLYIPRSTASYNILAGYQHHLLYPFLP